MNDGPSHNKILAVTSTFPPDVGGMQFSTQQTLLSLAKQGLDVHVICPKNQNAAQIDSELPINVIRFGGNGYLDAIRRLLFVSTLRKKMSFDHVLLMGHLEEIAFGILKNFFPDKPIILAAGTRMPYPGFIFKRLVRNGLLRRAYQNAKKIIFISRLTEIEILEHCKDLKVKTYIVPRPVDENIWKRNRSKQNSKFILVTFGRLVIEKNVQTVIDVVVDLKPQISNLEYWIIGDGNYKNKLIEKVEKSGSSSFVKFFGSMTQEQIVEKIVDADVFILLSNRESFGRVYAESAALGIPSIAYDVGGTSVPVKNGITGYLHDVNNLESVRNSILELQSDCDKYEAFSKAALKHFEDNFTLQKVGKKLKKALTDD